MILIISVALSTLAIHGFRFEVTDNYIKLNNTYTFYWMLLLLFITVTLYHAFSEKEKRSLGCSVLFSFIISTFSVIGVSIARMRRISWIWESRNYLINFLVLYYAQFILYFCISYLAFRWLKKISYNQRNSEIPVFSFKRVLLWWGILTLFFLPWYLHLYPGVLTRDSGDQIYDAITTNSLSDHHSAFLTLVMRGILLPIRQVSGSLQLSVGICVLLQMLIMTFVFAFSYEWIRLYLQNRVLRAIAFFYYALHPIHPIYSITIWKDILFSACFLALILCLDALNRNDTAFFSSKKKKLILFLIMLLLPLMRHNGIAITLITGLYLFFYYRSCRLQITGICIGVLLLFGIWEYLAMPALNVVKIAPAHTFSILEQQIVRTLDEHRDELDPEERSELESYFDHPEIWMIYNPQVSEAVKASFRVDKFDEDPGRFFTLWFGLGLRYPVTYLEAFLLNTYGYWFTEINYWYSDYCVNETAMKEDIHQAPILNLGILEKVCCWVRDYQFVKLPLANLMFNACVHFWIWIFCGCYCLYQNRKKFILILPGLALWLSILPTPLAQEFRYVYGLLTAFPLILAATLSDSESTNRK